MLLTQKGAICLTCLAFFALLHFFCEGINWNFQIEEMQEKPLTCQI